MVERVRSLFDDDVAQPRPSIKPESAPFQPHSEPSIAAAARIIPDTATLRGRVLQYITSVGGATDEQIQIGLEMPPNTQRPRRVELVQRGLVYDSGQRRITRSGRKATVWKNKP